MLFPRVPLADSIEPSARSKDMLNEVRRARTAEVLAHARDNLVDRQDTFGFDDRLLAMHPPRLDRVEPRTLARQSTLEDSTPTASALHASVVLANPGADHARDMPIRVVPHQHEDPLACSAQLRHDPGQELDRHLADGLAFDEAQQHT